MIPQAELERGIARWKARQSGAPEPPLSTEYVIEDEIPDGRASGDASGLISLDDTEFQQEP